MGTRPGNCMYVYSPSSLSSHPPPLTLLLSLSLTFPVASSAISGWLVIVWAGPYFSKMFGERNIFRRSTVIFQSSS